MAHQQVSGGLDGVCLCGAFGKYKVLDVGQLSQHLGAEKAEKS